MNAVQRSVLGAAVLLFAAGACQPDLETGSVNIVTEIDQCPLIDQVTVIPLEVVRGGRIEVSATTTFGAPKSLWRASAGDFEDPLAPTTAYVCDVIGNHLLTFTIWDGPSCADQVEVEVMCSPSPSCGDGVLDLGEQCDDGNTASGDGCTSRCLLKPVTVPGPD